jgi:hypothetical protein
MSEFLNVLEASFVRLSLPQGTVEKCRLCRFNAGPQLEVLEGQLSSLCKSRSEGLELRAISSLWGGEQRKVLSGNVLDLDMKRKFSILGKLSFPTC